MKYIDWIDDYIAGELPDVQRLEFEEALQASPELRNELAYARTLALALALGEPEPIERMEAGTSVAAFRHARETEFQRYAAGAMHAEERTAFTKAIETDDLLAFEWVEFQKNRPAVRHSIKLNWVRWAAAACIIGLLGLAAWWLVSGSGGSGQALFAKYDRPELFPKSDYALVNEAAHHRGIGGSKSFNDLKINGLKAYDAKGWGTAIGLLTDYVRQTQPTEEDTPDEINLINLYIGRAYLEKGEPGNAVIFLTKADAGVVNLATYGKLRELMRWQLVLAYLKMNDTDAAKKVAQTLVDATRNNIRQNAQQLLNDLK